MRANGLPGRVVAATTLTSASTAFRLGDGTNRLKAASLINPQEKEQPPGGLPLFFATKRKKGGALCAYGGHFTTGSFEILADAQRLRFKERDRQVSARPRRGPTSNSISRAPCLCGTV